MSTEPNREEAKEAIVQREKDDPELDAALSSAHQYQLGLAKEQNRHKETMRGWIGRVFGHDDNLPSHVAAFGMAIGLLIYIGCLVAASGHTDATGAALWSQQGERALAFSASCLAFIFGKGLNK